MRKYTLTLSLVVFSAIYLISCQKEGSASLEKNFKQEAKTWFSNTVLAEEAALLAKPFSELPRTSANRFLSRMNRLSKKLDWANAKDNSVNGLEYTVVPLMRDELNLDNNYFVKRVFIFYRGKEKDIQLEIVEILTKNQKIENAEEVASAVFKYKKSNKLEVVQSPDVFVFFYDKFYNSLSTYEIKRGSLKLISSICINKDNLLDGQIGTDSEGGNCVEWGVFWITYDGNGNVINEELLYTYWVGDCGNGSGVDTGESSDPSGSGGSGGSSGSTGNDEEFDLDAEALLLSQVLSSTNYPQEKNITYTSELLTGVPFQWTVVENSSSLWKVISSDIAEGYNSASTGAILYRIQHQGSTISGLTQWGRIRRDGSQGVPFININWSESSSSTSIASDYRSGTISVAGTLKNYFVPFKSVSNSCTIRPN